MTNDIVNSIEIKNLTKEFKSFKLDNVSFNVPKGTVVGFIGENGAGKTTTLKSILGLLMPDIGSITVLGEDAGKLSGVAKEKIGVVFDSLMFPEALNGAQLDKVMRGIYKTWNSNVFFSYLDKFQLPRTAKFKTFSRGMKMKLSIAVALSHSPDLLVLDEATGGLDPIVRSEILDIFLEFMQDENHSILMSTHITSDLEHIADYICFIHGGRIVFMEERNEMLEKYRILHCTEQQLKEIDKADLIGVRKGRYTIDALTMNVDKYSGVPSDVPSIEEIMVYYVREKAEG